MTTTKRIESRLSAWWSAWKYVVILGVALSLSLWGNLHQYVGSKTRPLKEEIASKDQALDHSAALLDSANKRAAVLDAAAARNTANLEESSDAYRDAARQRPLAPNCAPGKARVDAVNRALGARPSGDPK